MYEVKLLVCGLSRIFLASPDKWKLILDTYNEEKLAEYRLYRVEVVKRLLNIMYWVKFHEDYDDYFSKDPSITSELSKRSSEIEETEYKASFA